MTDPPSRSAARSSVRAAALTADGLSCHSDVAPPMAIRRRGRGKLCQPALLAEIGTERWIGNRDRQPHDILKVANRILGRGDDQVEIVGRDHRIAEADNGRSTARRLLDVARHGHTALANSDHQRRPWRRDFRARFGVQLRNRDTAKHRGQVREPAVAHQNRLKRNSKTFGEGKHLTIVPAVRTKKHPHVRTLCRNHITFDYIQ